MDWHLYIYTAILVLLGAFMVLRQRDGKTPTWRDYWSLGAIVIVDLLSLWGRHV